MLPDNNNILDIIISLVLIYALLSILVSVLTEWYNQRQKARAVFLKMAIFQLLNDPLNVQFGELFYSHYLVNGLHHKEQKRKPQYISSRLFAEVLIDLIITRKQNDTPIQLTGKSDQGKQYELIPQTIEPGVVNRIKQGLDTLQPSPLTDTLRSLWEKSKDLNEFKSSLCFWYDDYMDRVSGWYKHDQRWTLRLIGLVVAFGLNADSLHLIKVISLDDKLRSNLVSTAEKVADQYQTLSDTAKKNTSTLINVFNLSVPDSLRSDSARVNHVAKILKEKDSKKFTQAIELLKLNDSLSTVYMYKADSVLGIAAGLNIPIGWDWSSAPLSWFRSGGDDRRVAGGKGILAYIERRNVLSWRNFLYYLLGIFITGISLSFGAPFWFETLVKLINVRKAGKKPEAMNSTQK